MEKETKERILEAATDLLQEPGRNPETVTVREIASRAGASIGLVNYYFGSRKGLIEACVEKIIRGIVHRFEKLREDENGTPAERLAKLGDITLDYLFDHVGIARISMLSDMKDPRLADNTQRTLGAFLPLVQSVRPDLTEREAWDRTFVLICTMQDAFLRADIVRAQTGEDLAGSKEARHVFHRRILSALGLDGEAG